MSEGFYSGGSGDRQNYNKGRGKRMSRRRRSDIYQDPYEDDKRTRKNRKTKTKRHFEQKLEHLRKELEEARERRGVYEAKGGPNDDWGMWIISNYEQQIEKTLQKMRDMERRGGM